MSDSQHLVSYLSTIFKKMPSKIYAIRSRPNRSSNGKHPVCDIPEGLCRKFSLSEIQTATNNFHDDLIIGQGEFGRVYKGFIRDEGLIVTLKRYSMSSKQWFSVFQNELKLLCQLHHPHLISLIGFCDDTEMVLVYEYMDRGSLYNYLHETGVRPLSWKQRLEVCIGVARAICYLHTGSRYVVIHRGVSSANILLDERKATKLANFWFSKIGPLSTSKAPIKIKSELADTVGLVDPELVHGAFLTDKFDVFSFGVVLFEVLCAKGPLQCSSPTFYDKLYLIGKALEAIERGTIYEMVDPYLKRKIAPESFRKFVKIAYNCLYIEGKRRPDMGEVEVALELALELQEEADVLQNVSPEEECMYGEVTFSASINRSLFFREKTCYGDSMSKNSGAVPERANTASTFKL